MFSFLKNKLKKIYTSFTSKAQELFSRNTIDEQALKELEVLLLSADTGVQTTRTILATVKEQFKKGAIKHGDDLKKLLEQELLNILQQHTPTRDSNVHVLVGINGSGKTTFVGKLANFYAQQNKKVLLVAADTFRAAATEQLQQWAQKTGAEIVIGKQNQDPASVVYTGCQKFKNEHFDVLIIDTAGRLQTKINLMRELEKVTNIIKKQLPNENINTLLTVDSMLGQNSLEQARLFHESTQLSGIVLTKMDATGKGGIVFAITQQLNIPIAYISFGEQVDQFALFDAHTYVNELLQS